MNHSPKFVNFNLFYEILISSQLIKKIHNSVKDRSLIYLVCYYNRLSYFLSFYLVIFIYSCLTSYFVVVLHAIVYLFRWLS